MIDYEAEIRECMARVRLCPGCEEEFVRLPEGAVEGDGPFYCTFCRFLKAALEMDYRKIEERSVFAGLPREDAGVVRVEDAGGIDTGLFEERPARRAPRLSGREMLLVSAYLAPGLAVACAAAWFAMRLVCWAGLVLYAAVQR